MRVEPSAQDHALPFYERLGYRAFGDAYPDEGIAHYNAFKVVTAWGASSGARIGGGPRGGHLSE